MATQTVQQCCWKWKISINQYLATFHKSLILFFIAIVHCILVHLFSKSFTSISYITHLKLIFLFLCRHRRIVQYKTAYYSFYLPVSKLYIPDEDIDGRAISWTKHLPCSSRLNLSLIVYFYPVLTCFYCVHDNFISINNLILGKWRCICSFNYKWEISICIMLINYWMHATVAKLGNQIKRNPYWMRQIWLQKLVFQFRKLF